MANVNKAIAKTEDKTTTPKGVAIYPYLFKMDEVQDAYAMMLAVDPENPELQLFKQAAFEFGKEAFASRGGLPDNITWPVITGSDWMAPKQKPPSGRLGELIEGSTLIKSKTVYQPTVWQAMGENEFVELEDEKAVYTGMIAAMEGIFMAYAGKYPSVVFRPNQVAKLGAGTKMGGNRGNPKTFGGMYEPEDDSVGAPSGLDDEIPF